jgi:general secretion pathway protein J
MMKMNQGFTLIEILVAIAIFGLLSIGAYTVLDAGMRSQQSTETRLSRLESIQRTVQSIEKDFRMFSLRQVRDEFGDKVPLLRGQGDLSGQAISFELTRGGWANPAELPRSNLQHVIYSFEQGSLKRMHSIFLDQATNSPKVVRTLIEDVQSMDIAFLDDNKQWKSSWGMFNADTNETSLPRAIKIKIEVQPFGLIERLIIVGASNESVKENSTGNEVSQ